MARASIGSATPISSSFHRLKKLSNSSPPLHVTFRRHLNTSCATTMSDGKAPHPSLQVTGGARHKFLSAFKSLHNPYNPYPIVSGNRHIETIFAAFFRDVPDLRLRRECLRTKDDGSIALDWVSGDDRSLPPDSPLLILLPGLTGGSDDSYVRHMLLRARSRGWRVVVFNSRGCGDSPVTTPQFYSASFLGDMYEVVAHVSNRYPAANLYAVGWSLGANILVRYLGQESHSCLLSGAVSLCNPFNLVIADEDFHKGFNNVYDKALANSLRKIFKKHALLFEDMEGEFNISLAANAKTVREFDDGLTRVSFGFKSVDDYYSNSSSSDSITNVCTPLLCIQAANDPIAPARGIPRKDIEDYVSSMKKKDIGKWQQSKLCSTPFHFYLVD
nr:embryogenesis-associated protein EMB8 isoform X2 [Solanum lycopersicum]